MPRKKAIKPETAPATPAQPPEKVLFQVVYTGNDDVIHRHNKAFENLDEAKETAISYIMDDAEARVVEAFVVRVEAGYRRRVDIAKVI